MKYLFFLLSIFFSCFLYVEKSYAQTDNYVIAVSSSVIGVVENNQITIFEHNGNEWKLLQNSNFLLPNGYMSVFGIGDFRIGVIVNNQIKFYGHNGNIWELLEYPPEFKLPNNYRNVFMTLRGDIGVVTNNQIQFYEYNNAWQKKQDYDLILPTGYKDIFGINDSFGMDAIGIVVNNQVQFYLFNNNKWELSQSFNFTIPSGHRSVFSLPVRFFGIVQDIGVILNHQVQFYEYNTRWQRKQGFDFMLSNK